MQNAWGRIVWIFLHTFAEKINPDFFKSNINICLDLVTNICYNLPCPICSTHARQFLQKHKIRQWIKTKEDFKRYLYMFHNNANTKTRKASPKADILDMYKRAVFSRVASAFYRTYTGKASVTRAYTDKMSRIGVAKNVMSFLQNNYKFFSN